MAASQPVKLATKQLGRTGMRVSEICFGAMTMGESKAMKLPTEGDQAKCFEMMDAFVQAGGNFIDTADVYGAGQSEIMLGKWLATKQRDDFVIATKCRNPMGPGPNDWGASRKHIMAAVDASLKRLGTDYIDIYQLHNWDRYTPLAETLSTMNDLVRAGKVRYIGVSNYTPVQIVRCIDMAKSNGWEPITCLQPQYNLLCREVEWELLTVAEEEGLGVIPWSPLLGGWLSGRYTREGLTEQLAGSRVGWAEGLGYTETNVQRINNDHTWRVIDAVREVAAETGKTMSQVSLNWVMRHSAVTGPIVGARNLEQLHENLGAAGWRLTDEQYAKLNAASEITVPYPYRLQSRATEEARRKFLLGQGKMS